MDLPDGLDLPDHRWIAHVLVERDGRVLLLRRRDGRYLGGHWDIPGGTVEFGESTGAAGVRETMEEAGLSVRVGTVVSHFTNADTEGRPICFHTVTFAGTENGRRAPVVLHPEEHDDHRWLTPAEAMELDLVWHVRRTLEGDGPVAGVEVP